MIKILSIKHCWWRNQIDTTSTCIIWYFAIVLGRRGGAVAATIPASSCYARSSSLVRIQLKLMRLTVSIMSRINEMWEEDTLTCYVCRRIPIYYFDAWRTEGRPLWTIHLQHHAILWYGEFTFILDTIQFVDYHHLEFSTFFVQQFSMSQAISSLSDYLVSMVGF